MASGGEAAPAPPGAAGGKRLKPELPGPCQAGGRTETGPFRSTGLSPSGSWGCGLDAKSGRVSVCPSQPPRPPTLSLPAPGPAIPAYSEGGNPGQPRSPLSRPLSRAPGGWVAALFPGRIGGGGAQGRTPVLPAWPLGCFRSGPRRATESDRDHRPGPGRCLAGMGPWGLTTTQQ